MFNSRQFASSHLKQILGILENFESINLFRFIINPDDFAQSVENLFHLSFLIRDGICSLETTDEGEPMITACEKPETTDYNEGLQKRQLVMEFDMATWRVSLVFHNFKHRSSLFCKLACHRSLQHHAVHNTR